MIEFDHLIVSCEHGGKRIPPKWRARFEPHRELLDSYRGHDKGALEVAREIAALFRVDPHFSTVSRLLVDLNRSITNREMWSPVSQAFSDGDKQEIVQKHYAPYRGAIESEIAEWNARNRRVLHLSVHTFTPVFNGEVRNADIGLLYDPSRRMEVAFCRALQDAFERHCPEIAVRRNYPYAGTDDGITRHLRGLFPGALYAGIELEINQRPFLEDPAEWLEVKDRVARTLRRVITIARIR